MSFFFRRAYLVWAGFWFAFTFLVLWPFFALCILMPGFMKGAVWVNRIWVLSFFTLVGIPVRRTGRWPMAKGQACIVCCNHGSYFDIPVLTAALPVPHKFIGKHTLAQIPLFGFMYSRLHILVNRRDPKDRKRSMRRCQRALSEGYSIFIFPEGKINGAQPVLASFYDGAFFMSLHMGVPILPISLPNTWKLLPDDGSLTARHGTARVILHDLIHPDTFKGMPIAEAVRAYKQLVYDTIAQGLPEHRTQPA